MWMLMLISASSTNFLFTQVNNANQRFVFRTPKTLNL